MFLPWALLLASFTVVRGQTCSNGVEGIGGDGVCCPIGCGKCGGSGCSMSGAANGLGKDSCCVGGVKARDEYCDETHEAPCIIGSRPVQTCSNGIAGIDGDGICCPLLCGQCGGAGCGRSGAAYGLGRNQCCLQPIVTSGVLCSESQSAPCIHEQISTTQTCSNGMAGIDGGGGIVCCPLACSQCGGSGCSTSGAANGLGRDSCCVGGVKASEVVCSRSGTAPCIIDQVTPVSKDCAAKREVSGSDVVLLIGQSNMSGHGRGYDSALDGPNDPRVRQWSRENTIIIAEEHLNHADYGQATYLGWVGMGTSFGRAYAATLPAQRNALLVPAADGGTALVDGEWSPADGPLLEDAIMRLQNALASDEGNCVAAILWHQGETDVVRGVTEEEYHSTLKLLIEKVRDRVPAASEAPFIMGEFTSSWAASKPNAPSILAATRAIPANVKYTAVASSESVATTNADFKPTESDIHFDAPGIRKYGFLYFGKLFEANENN